MARFEFTMVSDAMLQGLADAGATGSETRAYIMLVRGLPKDRGNAECWMPADMAEEKGVMSAAMFTKTLAGLSKKAFTTIDGEPRTVLTKLTRGCKGHCPHYEDTLGRLIAEGLYPPRIATPNGDAIGKRNGDPTGHPIEARNGTPKQAPLAEFSTKEWNTKTRPMEHQNEANGTPTGAPIETIQDIPVAAALLPGAEQGGGVCGPDEPDRDPSLLEGTEPPRATAGAAMERPAAALASWAELMGRELSDEELRRLAHECSYYGTRKIGNFRVLDEEDMYNIYLMAK